MRPLLAALALLSLFSLAQACGSSDDTKTVCTAGKVEACPCPGGAQGSQACKSDGSGFEACSCPGGAGGSSGGAGGASSAQGGSGFPSVAGSGGVGGLSTTLEGCTRMRYCCGLLPTESGQECLRSVERIEKDSASPSSTCNDNIAAYQNAGYCTP